MLWDNLDYTYSECASLYSIYTKMSSPAYNNFIKKNVFFKYRITKTDVLLKSFVKIYMHKCMQICKCTCTKLLECEKSKISF